MSDAQVYKQETMEASYGCGRGYSTPSNHQLVKSVFSKSPPFNARFNGSSPRVDYAAGTALRPSEVEWQRKNLLASSPGVGDTIQMLKVPTNHWIYVVRFDVNNADPKLEGATAAITGQRVNVNPADPYNKYVLKTDPEFAAAAKAQDLAPIPLDKPGSQVLWLNKIFTHGVMVDAPAVGGPSNNVTLTGYVMPYYVAPEFITFGTPPNGEIVRFETGSLLLGIKILSLSTANPSVNIWDSTTDFYLTTRVIGFACPSIT
ncbi:MAG: hypothetical protein LBR53_02180 [Deltaproteobacteria bacterium]|jgi:hypothetical protein|nr:hypothetical protein [Deltaproteobacteria bacterium]